MVQQLVVCLSVAITVTVRCGRQDELLVDHVSSECDGCDTESWEHAAEALAACEWACRAPCLTRYELVCYFEGNIGIVDDALSLPRVVGRRAGSCGESLRVEAR